MDISKVILLSVALVVAMSFGKDTDPSGVTHYRVFVLWITPHRASKYSWGFTISSTLIGLWLAVEIEKKASQHRPIVGFCLTIPRIIHYFYYYGGHRHFIEINTPWGWKDTGNKRT